MLSLYSPTQNTLFVIICSAEDLFTLTSKATITRCDLSPRFFCIDATLLCEFDRT